MLLITFMCACLLKYLEGNNSKSPHLAWRDAIFLSSSGVTASGFNSVDITLFSRASLNVLLLATQLGSATLLSLVPVGIRIRAIHKIIPPNHLRTFDLKNYKRVPEWMVEYKALQYLLRIVIFYNVLVYVFFGFFLYLSVVSSASAKAVVDQSAAKGDYAYFALFHLITAYNNCGFALQQNSFQSLQETPILLAMNLTILCGNVLYPILLRWLIIFLSSCVNKKSNRKVYLRFLLLNGRHLYSSLFGSQQTWLLLIQQMFLIFTQIFMTMVLSSSYDPTF